MCPDTLSQLIRTAFVASDGNVLIDADFSAIEARVISWLAGEQWRLEVFKTHGKIYEASASQMFGVPIERIKKGNPEYALRQKGKVAELALGYQGGTGALINMGALDMGILEDDLPDIVQRWRDTNKRICDLWYKMNSVAVEAISTGSSVGVGRLLVSCEYDAVHEVEYLTVLLPSRAKAVLQLAADWSKQVGRARPFHTWAWIRPQRSGNASRPTAGSLLRIAFKLLRAIAWRRLLKTSR